MASQNVNAEKSTEPPEDARPIPQMHVEPQKLGVTWSNLTIRGVSAEVNINENFSSQFNLFQKIKQGRGAAASMKTIIDKSHGHVSPGEMMLVIGRPGAGCTSLLNVLSNRRVGFAEIEGNVSFGAMDHTEAEKYSGHIVMNSEEEVFFPTLTVQETIDFATKMKTPVVTPEGKTQEEYRVEQRDHILKLLKIDHASSTMVGNAFVRGVSGGECKRVSIAECLATRGSVFCWDNSTRGLDAHTALEFVRTLRTITDTFGLTTIATFYQASNAIYDLFDKVLVLDHGKQIFYGPRKDAVPFMHNLGFYFNPAANVGDCLSGITVPSARHIRDGYKDRFPRTAEEIRDAYEKSATRALMETEYSYPLQSATKAATQTFQDNVESEKHKTILNDPTVTISFFDQLKHCIVRQYQILWGDKPTLIIKQIIVFLQALISGSIFYNASPGSTGLFIKGGSIFMAILYPALLTMGETFDSFTGRPVLAKHRQFGLHQPAAFCIAQIISDLPMILLYLSHFSIVMYFMTGLKMAAGAFFTFYFVLVSVTICFTAFFRMIGAAFPTFQSAAKVSGFAISVVGTYVGYFIPYPHMKPWFVWIFWINPMAYSFDALLSNEFFGTTINCEGQNLVPEGPTYTNVTHQACVSMRGAPTGSASLTGDQYLASLSFGKSHIWRNVGIIWAWWALYSVITIYFTRRWATVANTSRGLLVPRERLPLVREQNIKRDIESQEDINEVDTQGRSHKGTQQTGQNDASSLLDRELLQNKSVFTWKNLKYTVNVPGGTVTLLDDVYGWVRPGMLGALMGASGAGKTTLMDVLAQRKTDGEITGSILVDGKPLSLSFQRSAGYCEQLDVHERMATVRESLEFSALMRQSRQTPKADRLRYVDLIIDLLELQDIEHTLIGTPGNGLTVEQRKRVTIGVELVAKPEILLFLDEPTSGLDGQAALGIVQFLRKLADIGQAVLVVIHQPSQSLFAEFDTLLLLQRGGKMSYFGDIGTNGSTVNEYFARHGAPCPDSTNPAEHMIDIVSGSHSKTQDWHEIWKSSPEHARALKTLDDMVADMTSRESATRDDGHEFAASFKDQTYHLMGRMNRAIYRDTEYVNNRIFLHVFSALFNGFSFWMIGPTVDALQLRLFTIYNFVFVSAGVFAQLQPLFLERRDLYEIREKKSKTYNWPAFVTALIISEIPYLLISGILYFLCWYYTCGFPLDTEKAGATLFIMLIYEFLYTGTGQSVAAYVPNALIAAAINPSILGVLVSFCGVLVPFGQIPDFWRYWMYYIDPFNYLMGTMLVFTTYDAEVRCDPDELAIFDPPPNQTCAEYLADYMQGPGSRTRLITPDATEACEVCQYRVGGDYLYSLNLKAYYYGWRDLAITALFTIGGYALVYGLMKLRTKASKKAKDS